MTGEVPPDAFQKFEQPIAEALAVFSALTDGDVEFGPEATRLSQPEGADRPSSQPAAVRYLGETVGSLTAVIFKYYDGTGRTSPRRVRGLTGGEFFLETAKVLPRLEKQAQAAHGDVHLALAAFTAEEPTKFEPRLLAGSLSLFGRFRGAVELGYLGQNNVDFSAAMSGSQPARPAATVTVSPERLDPAFAANPGSRWTNDLRAVYNRYPGVSQIAGILTLDRHNGGVSPAQASLLRRLGTVEPVPGGGHRTLQPLQGR